jgi:hypothetical protein
MGKVFEHDGMKVVKDSDNSVEFSIQGDGVAYLNVIKLNELMRFLAVQYAKLMSVDNPIKFDENGVSEVDFEEIP